MIIPKWTMHCIAAFIVFIGVRSLYLSILFMIDNHDIIGIIFGGCCCILSVWVPAWIIYDSGIWNKKKK